MIAFLASFVGLWLIAAGLVAVVVDGTKSIAASQMTITPLGQTWFALSRSSLTAFQAGIRQNLDATLGPWIWDILIQPVLSLPTWAVLGMLGAILVWAGQPHGRRRRRPQMG
jgi:hypothetical protein